ncbi:Do family serine endopeptidase [Hyphomonas johnsonii]|jgi:serine protease Do|uniref:Probable periplasmic serine endoprotease DegP-like n=1 Tax=Hyphomonas johnsonii MHS-2 TaxID=1280950 RepID=A0A059FTF3_9PROT|nr:Do family serine endopeptidase [Hyphomonas johnsonii]KCZ93786.1 Do family protease [Hyphomonas johnsonii MHS-2]
MKKFGISRQALVAAVFGAAAIGTLTLAPKVFSPEAGAQPIAIEAPTGAPLSFADLIERVEPAVVSVNVVSEREVGKLADMEQFFEQFRGMPGFDEFLQDRQRKEDERDEPETQESRSLGSGFLISKDGYVVTNNHVVENAVEIEVTLKDGRELEAELVGTDAQTDLAVLRIKEKGTYPYVRFGNSHDMRKGDWVVALGNPFGLGGTATAGILSADGRNIGAGPYTDFLQIDASINRGNSGGPTFDLNGNVVGVNTAIFSPTGGSVGIGFAIPAELADEVTQAIIKDGRVSRGWLGVAIQDLTPDMAEAQGMKEDDGAIIADVTSGSPAEKGGLERGDIILSVNGTNVTDATTTTRVVGKLIANTANKFEIIRGGKRKTIEVTVGERPDDPNAAIVPASSSPGVKADPNGTEIDELGVTFKPMDDALRTKLGLRAGDAGLVVTDVARKGVFEDAGLQTGMVILDVNGQPATSVDAFEKAIAAAKKAGRTKVLIAVRIGQITNYRTLDLSTKE